MTDFKHITDWKLKAGSHEFPGPEGGTCINEAAIVAAGFEYKKVGSVQDLPPCFSKVLGGVALVLNDLIESDDKRNTLLMPLVTRLSGSADSARVERIRSDMIIGGAMGVFQSACVGGRVGPQQQTRYLAPSWGLQNLVSTKMPVHYDRPPAFFEDGLHGELVSAAQEAWLYGGQNAAASAIFKMAKASVRRYLPTDSALVGCVGVLTAAFNIGNQATPLEHAKVAERMDEARKLVRETVEA